MRVLGIDPGTATTGFGVIDTKNGKHRLVDAGVFRTPAKQAMSIRLNTIYDHMQEVISEFEPRVVAVEELFFVKNITTGISVAHARGVVLLAIQQAGLAFAEYTPLQIKQALTGYGRADKQQIQEMVRTMLNLKTIPRPDDAADALAVAITHANNLSY